MVGEFEMIAKRLAPSDETLEEICGLFLEPHVFCRLDLKWRTLFGMYQLLRAISCNSVKVYGTMDGDELKGLVFGASDGKGGFEAHLAYRRHVDVATEMLRLIPIMVDEYEWSGTRIDHIVGNVYTDNRAIRMTLKRAGLVDEGIDESLCREIGGKRYEVRRYVLRFSKEDLGKWRQQAQR